MKGSNNFGCYSINSNMKNISFSILPIKLCQDVILSLTNSSCSDNSRSDRSTGGHIIAPRFIKGGVWTVT